MNKNIAAQNTKYEKLKVALVCTQGGHLTELLQLIDAFKEHDYFFVTHYSSRNPDVEKVGRAYFTENIEANIFRFIKAFWKTFKILKLEKPDVIISSGAEIAVPFLLLGKFFSAKTIYIESWCRIHTRSITGVIAYPVVDIFLVQWPELLNVYGKKAQYWGAVI